MLAAHPPDLLPYIQWVDAHNKELIPELHADWLECQTLCCLYVEAAEGRYTRIHPAPTGTSFSDDMFLESDRVIIQSVIGKNRPDLPAKGI